VRESITTVWFEQLEVDLLALQVVLADDFDDETMFHMNLPHI
jgi:hypothetical protein